MKKNLGVYVVVLAVLCVVLGFGRAEPVWAEEGNPTEGTDVESLTVSAGKKGFHPSKGNYLVIRSYIRMEEGTADLCLKIYNKKGNFVFQKKFKNRTGGSFSYRWKGKPSKKNAAGVSAKKYVRQGTYTVELSVLSKADQLPTAQKTCRLKISKKAPAGKAGLMEAAGIPILTGDPEVDYMAEQICKSAKVDKTQNQSEKVKRIYHWMTVNQKHVHYYEGGTFKKYYNLASSRKKIDAYKKTTDALYKNGSLIYNYDQALIQRKWCMERRIGVCTDQAAIFKILCNHAGIQAGICSGYYLNRNGTKAPHAWNYAVVGGRTYYYDVDVEIQNYGKGQGDYYWYQKTRSEANRTHKFITID